MSIGRIPDDSVDVGVILASGLAEIGEELAATEGGIGKTEADIILAGAFCGFDPAGADFDVMQCTA